MNVTRSFVRPAPRFAASGLRRKWEKERRRRRRRRKGARQRERRIVVEKARHPEMRYLERDYRSY